MCFVTFILKGLLLLFIYLYFLIIQRQRLNWRPGLFSVTAGLRNCFLITDNTVHHRTVSVQLLEFSEPTAKF